MYQTLVVAAAAPAAQLHLLWCCCWALQLHQQLLLMPHVPPVL
jgi:hypothetical protein